jgi:hypothetical protein
MGSIACSDGHDISRVSNQVGLGRKDGICVQTLISRCGQTSPAHIGPEFSRPLNNGRGNRIVSEAARECVQPGETNADARSDQLAANFIISNLGNNDENPNQPEVVHPGSANVTHWVPRPAAHQAQRRAIKHDDSRHSLVLVAAFERDWSSLTATFFVKVAHEIVVDVIRSIVLSVDLGEPSR